MKKFPALFTEKEKRLKSIIHLTHRKLHELLYSLCRDPHLTADLVQQVYIKVWENLDDIDNDEKILPLLKLYSRNIFLNELKRDRIRQKAYNQTVTAEQWDMSGEEHLLNKEQQIQIQTAVKKLPAQQQQIFRMHKEQAMTYRQIAAQLNISTGTIEKQMNRALKFLRAELEEMRLDSYPVNLLLVFYLQNVIL